MLTETRAAESVSISADVAAYGYCAECRPVLFLRDSTIAHDYVDERRPWCEWRLVFRDGRLERREAVRVESRKRLPTRFVRTGSRCSPMMNVWLGCISSTHATVGGGTGELLQEHLSEQDPPPAAGEAGGHG